MKKSICMLAIVLTVLIGSPSVWAQSSVPNIQGGVQGIELCPQFICGFAAFAGVFQGRIGGDPNAVGLITAAMNHEPLPPQVPVQSLIMEGGVWRIQTATRRIQGSVTGGTITNLGSNIFQITISMEIRSGGTGRMTFAGFLNHNTPIPTFSGEILQLPLP